MPYSANKGINDLEAKSTPVNADLIVLGDTEDTNRAKKVTLTNVKAFLRTYFDTVYTNGVGTTDEIAYWSDGDTVSSLTTATYPSKAEISYVKGVTSAIQTQINTKAPSTAPTFATSITGSYLTASELLGTGASKQVVSLPVATYPSLTELTYIKGVTSAIQTQLDSKVSGNTNATDYTAVTVTNTTNETNLLSYAIAGGTLSTNKGFRFRVAISMGWTSNGSSLTLKVKYGATEIASLLYDPAAATSQTGYLVLEGVIIGAGSTSAQESNLTAIVGGMTDPSTLANAVRVVTATAAEDSTASKNFLVTATWQNASTDLTTTMLNYLVEKLS